MTADQDIQKDLEQRLDQHEIAFRLRQIERNQMLTILLVCWIGFLWAFSKVFPFFMESLGG